MKVIINKAERLWKMPQSLLGSMTFARKRLASRGVDLIDLDHFIPEKHNAISPPGEAPDTREMTDSQLVSILKQKILETYPYLKGASLDPDKEITLIPGIRAGSALIALGILNQGDIALYPDPGLQYMRASISLAEGHSRRYNLLESNDYVANISSLLPSSHKRMKILFVNYPHDPTGATVDIYFYRELLKALRSANILTVADCSFVYPGDSNITTPLQVKNGKRKAIELHTFATTLGIPGLGFAAGHKDVISIVNLLLGIQGFIPERHRIRGTIEALDRAQDIYKWRMGALVARRDILCNGLKGLDWHVRAGKLSPFVWARPPVRSTSLAFARRLFIKAGVKVTPGTDLGESGEGWVRMALIPDEDELHEAVRRLSQHSKIWQRKFRPDAR